MSIWSKAGRVGACISLLMYGNVMGMETDKVEKTEIDDSPAWPTMAIDGTPDHPEGKHLAEYHATARKRGYEIYMPKDARELDRYYRLFTKNTLSDKKHIAKLWGDILGDMEQEIIFRCLDGDLYFIDKYLIYLDNFIAATASFPDENFVASLYEDSLFRSIEGNLLNALSCVIYYVDSSKKEDAKYTKESTHILYVANRMDESLTKSGRKKTDFFNLFCKTKIDTEYKKSPEFNEMLVSFGRAVFGNGITLNLGPK